MFILVGVDKSVISTTKLDLENVILTPRRKSKKRSGQNFPAAKKPRRQKCKKYIIEKGLVLAPEAFDRIKTDIIEFESVKKSSNIDASFVTSREALKKPSKRLFISILNDFDVLQV